MANYETPLLVTGGGGHLARLILEELLHRGVVPGEIITTTREPARLKNLSDRGISVRYGDFDHPASLTEAFAGARRVLIVSTTPEAPYVHGKRFRQQRAGIEAAVAAGARHILYTSAPNPEPGTPAFWKQDHYDTEQVLKACGTTWTVLRHWEWPDWHLAHTWLPAIQRGAYVTATGQGRVAHITRIDTARADAGALLSDEVSNRTVDITGPEALGADEILGRLSSHLGRNVRV
ncbi:MAG TPA: NAD(P)H-binding protein, partial [Mycobacterium sp.]|nr:NAD(P)H-binding protein [Mycobacterium sp.]